MPLLDKEHLAQWLYETTPRQGDVGRFTWEYLPDEGITGKHAYQAWADVLLASEKWQAREAVLRLVDDDNHDWSSRPCQSCNAVTALAGRPFGCVRVARQRKEAGR